MRRPGTDSERDDPVYDLGGNVAEWAIDRDGRPVLVGGSVGQPARAGAATCGAAPAYHKFRDILDAAGKEAVTDP